jgi:hypothetical protein
MPPTAGAAYNGAGRDRPDGPQSHGCRGQVVGLTDHPPRALMPDIQITVSPAVMGSSHRVGPDRDHSVIVPLRRQRGSRLPADPVVESGHRGFAPMAASRYELASQSDGLGFRGVIEEEQPFVGERSPTTLKTAELSSRAVQRFEQADQRHASPGLWSSAETTRSTSSCASPDL